MLVIVGLELTKKSNEHFQKGLSPESLMILAPLVLGLKSARKKKLIGLTRSLLMHNQPTLGIIILLMV